VNPGAATHTAPVTRLPSAHVLGAGPIAAWLRTRFLAVPPAAAADLVIDARVAAPPTTGGRAPDLTLCWGRAAPAEGTGFSVVLPPARLAAERPTVELLAPNGPAGERVQGLLHAAGLATLVVADQPGGVAFRLVAGLINEAFTALAEGLADAPTLDLAMRLGVNYPDGPLAWAVKLGLADVLAGLSGLQREFGMERYAPSSLLRRHVTHGTSPLGA
jgi:3-hydroxybutyryl-CoA dehydrogenase